MKTDKELLELAAKAADMGCTWLDGSDCMFWDGLPSMGFWNPLKDDGDALRLAVKLKFDVMTRWGEPNAAVLDQGGNFTMQADVDLDMCAATRRAIVRAAAAIGEKL